MQTQPRFTVATFVLVSLVTLGFLSRLLAPYIVAPVNYRLANTQATFLQSGAHEHVMWFPISERDPQDPHRTLISFQNARRLDRPILLVVGAPWSQTGRRMDSAVFSSIPVQKLLSRNFVCIRVDAVENPDWMSAFLPIGRAQLSLSGDYQIWLLDSEAHLFAPVALNAQLPSYGDTQFADELVADLAKLQSARDQASEASSADVSSLQAADWARLHQPPQNLVPSLPGYRDTLLAQASQSPLGGFPIDQHQRLWPDAWQFLAASAGPTSTAPTIENLLKSPTRDMLDGGFFVESRNAAWTAPSFDKVAVVNAEMCLLLSQLASSGTSETPYARFAGETFDSLTGEFVDSEGIIRPCRIGDERANPARSLHSSFNPRQVRSLLDGVERDWAQSVLHLRPTTNPAMTPFLTDFSQLDTPMYGRVVPKLVGFGPAPTFDPETTLASFGTSIARLLQAARVLHDSTRLKRAHDIAGRIDLFRRGAGVVHELDPSERARPTLVDYLAFADVELQDFLASSRVESLQDGAAVLKKGLDLFGTPGESFYLMALPDPPHSVVRESPHSFAPDSNSPQICDDTGESANATVIRLTLMYSQLLARSSSPAERRLAGDFRAKAMATVTQFADIAPGMGPYTGGYAMATAMTTDDTLVLCSGPDPVKLANDFASKSPFRLVVPVAGPVYPELLGKPGYYVVRRGKLLGPLTESATQKLLPPTLFIGG